MESSRAPCPDPDRVLDYLADPAADGAHAIREHLDRCVDCRRLIAELAKTSLVAEPTHVGEEAVPMGEYLPVGTPVGRYVLGEQLGMGGMGVVYEATDPALGRAVAIKVLRTVLAGDAIDRLVAEAQAMAKVSNPNVREVYDIGEVGGRVFVAMELVDGQTLEDWLAARPPTSAVLEAFVAAGRGLAAAHASGIAHRDFKPSNVLLAADGRILLSDFGLASSRGNTAPGGTPRYMAPEQHDGRGDVRVDQYAFGVALDEALEGRRVSRRVRRVIHRARQQDPAARFRSMTALLAALQPRRRGVQVASAGAVALAVGLLVAPQDAVPPPQPPAVVTVTDMAVPAEVLELSDRSRALYGEGKYQASVEVAEQALALSTQLGNGSGQALAYLERGRARAGMGLLEQADADTEQAYLAAVAAGREDLAAKAASDRIHLLSHELGRHDEAMQWGRHARASLERFPHLEGGWVRFEMNMAAALAAKGQWSEAAERTTVAVDYARTVPGAEWMLSTALSNRGQFVSEAGDLDAALLDSREAVEVALAYFGTENTEVARAQAGLAAVYKQREEYWPAMLLLARALRTFEAEQGPEHPTVAAVLLNLGAVWAEVGEPARAVTDLQRAVELLGPEHPYALHGFHNLGVALRELDRCEDALVQATHAIELSASLHGGPHPAALGSLRLRAECSIHVGDLETARQAATLAATLVDADDLDTKREVETLLRRARGESM